ncbi:hypothetical protein JCM10914A_55000 [Paenibacillus sp. JCM 10914]|uniref:helix-turn-helix domain-containing protein n=1 Tax=Paenibacillus sp. JCM 10914 TaxID=1236974 RepID=UPI0003CC3FA3|nr:helix-turn-helix domain-containing protein [Paenibacillus sp. JCM 10914]GAE04757.1 hypothetical protein JCM10914_828 [Paenibacillus sp. JCM 10914]
MKLLQLAFPRNSLFVKMLLYFLIVIVLLSSYNIWSMTFYTRHVNNEIVKYNLTLIRNTVDNFEKQYSTWKSLLLNLQHDEYVGNISRQADTGGKMMIDYLQVDMVTNQIRTLVSQPFYHLNNVMVYYRNHSFLLERDGIVNDDRMFAHYYTSESYPLEFWKRGHDATGFLQILPSRPFAIGPDKKEMLLLPLTTNVPNNAWEIIAFVNMQNWYESYQGMTGSRFLLLDTSGTVLFESAPSATEKSLPAWDGQSEWMMSEGSYYFFEQGSRSGLTYVSVIPHSEMNQSISRMNWIAILLFASTLLIGILASWFFTRQINLPLKRIITGLDQSDSEVFSSTISEFNKIASHLNGLQRERIAINEWMDHTKPLLTSYNYMARFKNIEIDARASNDLWVSDGDFMVIVYGLRYRQTSSQVSKDRLNRTTGKIKEIIELQVQDTFPLSHTLQMESNQILSIVYTGDKSAEVQRCLNRLAQIFDHDRTSYLVTITVSSVFQQTSSFDQAYAEAMALFQQAMPIEETQIIWEKEPTIEAVGFTAEQEHEFYVNLQAGNEASCLHLVDRAIERLQRQHATAEQLHQFAWSVSNRMRRTMELLKIDTDSRTDSLDMFAYCITTEQYREALHSELSYAAHAIRIKREEHYDIIQYVIHYLESHYAEEISLEQLAHKLNMSPTYLSGYIKEKTGSNFSDQLNAIRITKAKKLLESNNIPVAEVGSRIGYRNVTSFIRMFKKITGQTPGDYRKTHRIRK